MRKILRIVFILGLICFLMGIHFYEGYVFPYFSAPKATPPKTVLVKDKTRANNKKITFENVHSEFDEDEKPQKPNYTRKSNDRKLYNKEVFLTFDDGPSTTNTLKVLEILKKNDIKATFFVLGKKVQENPAILKAVSESGMCILPHSQTHDYKIYRSFDSYLEDLNACITSVETVTHKKPPYFTRFPGGSDNLFAGKEGMRKIRNELKKRGFSYVDWNVSSADAAADTVSMDKIKYNVISQCSVKKLSVVLMHDSYPKTTTVEALPYIIKYLKENGYTFRTFEDITATEQKEMIREGIINR